MNSVMRCCRQVGWSGPELARRLRVPEGIVQRWERGESIPPAWIEQRVRIMAEEERQRQHGLLTRKRAKPGTDPRRAWRPEP